MLNSAPLGVLGGTFNPVHLAHLRLAEELAQGVGLERVYFVPAGTPPHRQPPKVDGRHRLEMIRLAIAGNPLFEADDRELRRQGISYTYDTLAELRAGIGVDRPLCLLMGADAFPTLTTWHRWSALFELAHIVIAHRPGYPLKDLRGALPEDLRHIYVKRLTTDPATLGAAPSGAVLACEISGLDISATRVRNLLARGAGARYLVPDAVLDYISRNHLYKETDAR